MPHSQCSHPPELRWGTTLARESLTLDPRSSQTKAIMTGKSPVATLNNGVELAVLGLGVLSNPPEQTADVVEAAIASGYRLIDTAAAYRNERQVGEGIARSGVPRPELFVTTKLWMTSYGYDQALRAFDASIEKLALEYLDLYLLHWPVPLEFEATIASYRAAQRLLADGRVRAIGVSNFSSTDLERLLAHADVIPAVNQIELHPFFTQQELREAHARLGIVTQAWSPIGGVYGRNPRVAPTAASTPLRHQEIIDLASKHGKTPAQIVLRWHIELSHAAIPKSVRHERLTENIDIFDFALDDNEVASISSLDTGIRAGADPRTVNAATFGIVIEAE
jgi:diketogulonate reductase-like aldo/keto reductase